MSEASKIKKHLESIGNIFEFDKNSGARLAKSMTDAAVQGIRRNTRNQSDPDGVKWAPLSPGYRAQKERLYGKLPIGVLEGDMLAPTAIPASVALGVNRATIKFGDTPIAKDHLEWFSEGGGNQPAREVVGITREAEEQIDSIIDKALDKVMNK